MIKKLGLTVAVATLGLVSAFAINVGDNKLQGESISHHSVKNETVETAGVQPSPWSMRLDIAGLQPEPWSIGEQVAGVQPSPWSIKQDVAGVQPSPWSMKLVAGVQPSPWSIKQDVAGVQPSPWSIGLQVASAEQNPSSNA